MKPEGWLHVAGQRLEYRHVGPAPEQAPCLVLLHEGLGCAQMWRDFPQALHEATRWGVFCYSRAGYGASSPCELPRPLTYMHDEGQRVLPELLSAIGFGHGVLLGHSDGASIAAIHAGTLPHPGLAGLVLMAPHFFTEDITIEAIRQARTEFEDGNLRNALAAYHGKNVDCAFHGWNAAWLDPGFRAFDIRDRLSRIRVPLCVIQGHDDQYGSGAQVEEVQRQAQVPVSVRMLEDCGHSPQREQRQAVLAEVSRFVAGLEDLTQQ